MSIIVSQTEWAEPQSLNNIKCTTVQIFMDCTRHFYLVHTHSSNVESALRCMHGRKPDRLLLFITNYLMRSTLCALCWIFFSLCTVLKKKWNKLRDINVLLFFKCSGDINHSFVKLMIKIWWSLAQKYSYSVLFTSSIPTLSFESQSLLHLFSRFDIGRHIFV